MSNENKSVHEFDYNFICEYFIHLERQGPGSREVTLKPLSFIDNLDGNSRIADLGCGIGGQTMTLAGQAPGQVTGLDLFPGFIERFNFNAKQLNLQQRVKGIVGSMEALPFAKEELDLIWSEGAIAHIGFERGLTEWRKFLKTGGYVAISDASWFTPKRPAELEEFWTSAYADIDTISNNVAKIQKAGYLPVATFILPEECWMENYFYPQIPVQEEFLKKNAGNKTVEEFIAAQRHHAKLYKKYKELHGYVFYIAKKNS